jgi:hypothetical protein
MALAETTRAGVEDELREAMLTGRAELVCPLLLRACWFAEPVVLSEAKAPVLLLPGCHLPGLSAARLTARGDLRLGDGLTAGAGSAWVAPTSAGPSSSTGRP